MNVNVREVEAKGVTTAIVIEFPKGLTGRHRESMVRALEFIMADAQDADDLDTIIDDAQAYRNG